MEYDEYQWERIFREEDGNINAYMKELPHFIDFPDEEDILAKHVQNFTAHIPQPDFRYDSYADDLFEFDDNLVMPEDWQSRKGADLYVNILNLAMQWCRIYAVKVKRQLMPEGLQILCLYGMLISRAVCIMGTPPDLPALSIAYAKRLNADINKLIGLLYLIGSMQDDMRGYSLAQIMQLQLFRDKIVELIYEYKSNLASST